MSNFKKLSKDVKENLSEDGYWQSVLDLGYNEWNREGSEVKDYNDMLEWMNEKYGNFAVLAILAGKYNHQVCNGGHHQYFYNGYASDGNGSFGRHTEEINLHEKLIELMKEYKLDSTELSKKVFDIVSSFEVDIDDEEYTEESCFECGGSGEMADYDDPENDEYVTCSECDGSGTVEEYNENHGEPMNTSDWDSLDTRYYEVCDEWEIYFEKLVKVAVENR